MKKRNHLALQLLQVTFSIYLVVSISITVVQMYIQWGQYEKHLLKDLFELGDSSKDGIMLAMWDLDYKQVEFIAKGLVSLPIVIGVEAKDKQNNFFYGERGDIGQSYDLIYSEGEERFDIGKMSIYSSYTVIFDRIKYVYLITIISALIKVIVLWIIVMFVSNKLVAKPLSVFTEYCQFINMDQLADSKGIPLKIELNYEYQNEMTILKDAFNAMLMKLAVDRNSLEEFNKQLELKVLERTKELNKKNTELQRLYNMALDANPITKLPGNNSIAGRIEKALINEENVCVLYIDLDNFKAFNDKYGFALGDEVILFTSQVIKDALDQAGTRDGFIGHIGGDDFVVVIFSSDAEIVANSLIRQFDEGIIQFYSPEDAAAKCIKSINRQGEKKTFPIMSVSLGAVDLSHGVFKNYLEVNDACAEVKKMAKNIAGSNFFMDRRSFITAPSN